MAKGNSPVNSLFAIILIGGIILVLLLMAAVVIFPAVVAMILIFLAAIHRAPRLPPSEISDPPELTATCMPLMTEQFRLRNDIRNIEEHASSAGIQRTQASDGRRFDGRTRIGRAANERLDVLEYELGLVLRQLTLTCESHWNENLKPYEMKLKIWRFRVILLRLLSSASIFTVITMGLIFKFGLFDSTSIIYRSARYLSLDINPGLFSEFEAATAVATIIIWYFLMFAFYIPVRNRVPNASFGFDYSAYLMLKRKWVDLDVNSWPVSNGNDAGKTDTPKDPPNNEQEKLTTPGDRSWRDVLGLGPNPDVDEIKSAYRVAISQYHSDKVALLGEKIRKVAEDESKAINQAYVDAKREVGF